MTRMCIDNQVICDADIFQTIIDNFPDIIHSIDSEGRIVFANNKAEHLLGYALDELLTMNIRDLYADEIREALEEGFADLKKTGDATVESVLKHRDGSGIPVEIRSFGIYDDQGQFIRTFSILRDIRKIKALQADLVHAGRLAAIGELSSGIAHDINNPLAVILLAADETSMLLEDLNQGVGTPAGVQESVEIIKKAAGSIHRLVSHLRRFSRGMAEKKELIDLGQSIRDAAFITQSRVKRCGVELAFDLPLGRFFTRGCANHIEQVFANLFTNACDAMEDGEQRVLSVSISPDARAGFWRCDVSDTGHGIPSDLRENIFRSFFTTKAVDKGTGLGLSIVRGIVEDHGGQIELTSREGCGTTFSVLLPRHDAEG